MNYLKKAIEIHYHLKGKLSILSKIKLTNKKNLTLAYTPGVAEVAKAISKNNELVNDLTIKHNTIAVITDGSAVLGLGNIGPEAALPVMEGKCAIFKTFAGIDAFPICLKTQDKDKIVDIIKNISPSFGGINLEDISAPRCFEIESKLQKILDIPVVHDDQHATATVILAGLYNAAKIVKKELNSCKIVIVGAGAAGTATAKLFNYLRLENILVVDSQGILSRFRKNLPPYKKELTKLTNKQNIEGNLIKAATNADVLIGVATKGLFTNKIISSMHKNSIVFALANPDPEIDLSKALKWGVKVYANGRSDCPNQINNALVFPGFFKGLLHRRITTVTYQMKVNAAKALASLIKNPTAEYFISSIFDKRIVPAISTSLHP